MSSADQARETQLKNIQAKTGRSLDEVRSPIKKSGLSKHSEIRAMLGPASKGRFEVDKELLGWIKTAYDGSG